MSPRDAASYAALRDEMPKYEAARSTVMIGSIRGSGNAAVTVTSA